MNDPFAISELRVSHAKTRGGAGADACPPTWVFSMHGAVEGGSWEFPLTIDGTTETIVAAWNVTAAALSTAIQAHSKYGEPDTPTIVAAAHGPLHRKEIHIRWSDEPPALDGDDIDSTSLDGEDGCCVRLGLFGSGGSGGESAFDAGEILTLIKTVDGTGSGLDADTVDGVEAASLLQTSAIGTTVQAQSANLDEYAAVNPTAAGLALLDDTDAAAQQTTLGLGSIATQAASGVTITGGSVTGITDLAIADGGTGASTAYGAADNLSIHGADVASAGTLNLDTATGELVDVTGTTTITAITLSEGRERTVRFTGALTLTHGSSLVLPGSANITTVAGDFAIFRGYAAGVVRCVVYSPLTVTGTGAAVRATSPTLVTPALGTPASGNLANCTAFVAAGGSHAKGVVPDPGATAYTNHPRLLGSQAGFVAHSGKSLGDADVATTEGTAATHTTAQELTTQERITFTLDVAGDVRVFAKAEGDTATAGNAAVVLVDPSTGTPEEFGRYVNPGGLGYFGTILGKKTYSLSAGTYTFKMMFRCTAAQQARFQNRVFEIVLKS
jgi:hypothetical protein